MTSPSAQQLTATQRIALVRQLRAVLERDPRNVGAHVDLAAAYSVERNFDPALEHLQKAAALKKRDADILRRLTNLALDAKKLQLARKYGRRLRDVEPSVANNHRLLGLVHMDMGQPKYALECFEKANRLRPANLDTLNFIGDCHSLMGNHERAKTTYREVLELAPLDTRALYNLAQISKFTGDDVEAYVAQTMQAADQESEPLDKASMHYAAGKALDDAGRYDAAFSHFTDANRLQVGENPEPLIHGFANNENTYSTSFFASRADWGHESNRPIFVLGLPRSGTTLVESLLGSHSKITAADEQTKMAALNSRLGRDSDVEGAYRRNVDNLNNSDVRKIAEEYLEFFDELKTKTPFFTDKLPHNFMNIGLIALVFPNAHIIHCRRHPIANCFSLFSNAMRNFHTHYKSDLEILGVYYRQYAKLMEHWRQVAPIKMHEVFYEDVVANTEFNARAMIDYLGLKWEDDVMDRQRSQRSVRTLSSWQVRQPVYQSSTDKWRGYEKQLKPLIDTIGDHVSAYEKALEKVGNS